MHFNALNKEIGKLRKVRPSCLKGMASPLPQRSRLCRFMSSRKQHAMCRERQRLNPK